MQRFLRRRRCVPFLLLLIRTLTPLEWVETISEGTRRVFCPLRFVFLFLRPLLLSVFFPLSPPSLNYSLPNKQTTEEQSPSQLAYRLAIVCDIHDTLLAYLQDAMKLVLFKNASSSISTRRSIQAHGHTTSIILSGRVVSAKFRRSGASMYVVSFSYFCTWLTNMQI